MKKILQILLNPFATISDKKQTTIGITSLIIGILIAYFMNINLQILRIDPVSEVNLDKAFLNQIIITVFLTASFFGIGKIINKKTRFIDILNGVLISFIAIYISLFQNINNYLTNETNKIFEAIKEGNIYNISPSIIFILISLIGLFFFVYYIYLLFMGFKTATNAKKAWQYVLFFATLIIIDLITSYLINSI